MTIYYRRDRRILSTAIAALFALVTQTNAASVSVMNWNMGNLPNNASQQADLSNIFGHVGTITSGGFDLLAMVETDTTSAADTTTVAQNVFGRSGYASIVSTADGGGDRTGFIYDTAKLNLLSSSEPLGASLTHRILRAQFRPVDGLAGSEFYVYSIHLKSADSSTDRAIRLNEAAAIRADADALGEGANVLYVGDFNWTGPDERGANPVMSAFDAFVASGNGQAFDPANAVGDWRDNPAYLSLHTNDPGGAMDDRFDMQLATGEFFDGTGLEYLSGSYRVVGNNGTHTLNGDIRTGTGAPANVLESLYNFSDHLPVLTTLTYEVPEPTTMMMVLAFAPLVTRRRRAICDGLKSTTMKTV